MPEDMRLNTETMLTKLRALKDEATDHATMMLIEKMISTGEETLEEFKKIETAKEEKDGETAENN